MKSLIKRMALKYLPESILIAIKKRHYSKMLESFSEENEETFKIVKYIVSPGDGVIDLGANIGVYTNFLSGLVGNSGVVYSFEPIPATYAILSGIAKRRNLNNVSAYNYAISDSSGKVTMQVPVFDKGGEDYYQAMIIKDYPERYEKSLRHIDVECRTLDSVLDSHSSEITFIKCDVEGHELRCIKGAAELIKRSQPAWLIEINRDPDDPAIDSFMTFQLLAEHGYKPYWFDGEKLRLREKGTRWRDYFFFTEKHVRALRDKGVLN